MTLKLKTTFKEDLVVILEEINDNFLKELYFKYKLIQVLKKRDDLYLNEVNIFPLEYTSSTAVTENITFLTHLLTVYNKYRHILKPGINLPLNSFIGDCFSYAVCDNVTNHLSSERSLDKLLDALGFNSIKNIYPVIDSENHNLPEFSSKQILDGITSEFYYYDKIIVHELILTHPKLDEFLNTKDANLVRNLSDILSCYIYELTLLNWGEYDSPLFPSIVHTSKLCAQSSYNTGIDLKEFNNAIVLYSFTSDESSLINEDSYSNNSLCEGIDGFFKIAELLHTYNQD